MAQYSYHASHEQFAPSQLLDWSQLAEHWRFDSVFCSDHLQPWSRTQGHSGHAWTWLGAVLQATSRVSVGTITVPGGPRYHPVILAQAISTLCELFPGRLPWIAVGSGEALNEAPLGGRWPGKHDRNTRLLEGVAIVRALLRGDMVTHFGALEALDARLWVHPPQVPLLFAAAMTETTAKWAGEWADGLLTLGRDLDQLARIMGAFRAGGGQGKPVHVKLDTCLGESRPAALQEAHERWRFTCVDPTRHHNIRSPDGFETASSAVTVRDIDRHVFAWCDPCSLIEHVWSCVGMGVQAVNLHHVGVDQSQFIQLVGAEVLPVLRSREAAMKAV